MWQKIKDWWDWNKLPVTMLFALLFVLYVTGYAVYYAFISDEPALAWKRSALEVSEECFVQDEVCREQYRECIEEDSFWK